MSKRHNEIKKEKIEAIRLVLKCVGLDSSKARWILQHLEKLGYRLERKDN